MSYLGSTPASQFFAPGTDTFSGTGSQTAFTLSRNVATVNDILVVVNNVDQQPSNYTVLNNVLTFSPAPSAGTNNIYVRYLSTNITAIVPSASGTANSTTFLRGDNTWAVVSVTPTAVSDQANTSIGYFDLPSGTTAQRPASPPTGGSRFNTTTGYPEYYDGTNWWQFNQTKNFAVDYIVVAGGGGSGVSYGAGGGGGGYLSGNALSIPYGGSYTVTVGAGGAARGTTGQGNSGSNSVFSSFTSTGGGGGGYGAGTPFAGSAGGSGGGGGAVNGSGTVGGAGTVGQGNNGGTGVTNAAAGGGGYGSVGGNGAATVGGAGGSGVASSISGSSVYYSGGGSGAGTGGGAAPGTGGTALNNAGAANTGAGGGGEGRAGGSGIVIIRYSDAAPDITTIGGGLTYTRTVAGGYKVYSFTAGTGTITF